MELTMKLNTLLASIIIFLLLITGCKMTDIKIPDLTTLLNSSENSLTIPVSYLKPAREPSSQNMHRIAVVYDKRELEASSLLEANLASIKLNNSPYFTLVERSAIEAIIDEQKMHDGILTDSATRVKLGKLTGADTLLSGKLSINTINTNYKEERQECIKQGDNWYKCDKYRTYSVSCSKKEVVANLDPKAISVETGRIILSKKYRQVAEHNYCNDDNEANLSDEKLTSEALAKISTELRADVAPFFATTDVELMESVSSKVSEKAQDLFKMGVEFAEEQLYENACLMFKKSQSEYASSIAITYNNAVCAEFSADVEMAEAFYHHATEMTNDIDALKLIIAGEKRIKQRLVDTNNVEALNASGAT